MYISKEAIRALEQKFGKPLEVSLAYEMTELELEHVRVTQKHGRAHDATMFIIEGATVAVIRKPMYPRGAWRAPSGGVMPGEDFEAGALREGYEETGLKIELENYIVRSRVRFSSGEKFIDWTSHVFSARRVAGELNPIDTHEIDGARYATRDELLGSIRAAMLESGSTGLRYRAELNDVVMSRLIEMGKI